MLRDRIYQLILPKDWITLFLINTLLFYQEYIMKPFPLEIKQDEAIKGFGRIHKNPERAESKERKRGKNGKVDETTKDEEREKHEKREKRIW